MNDMTVTVIGMIAAFLTASVTAFFAEPVKMYYQNRTRLKTLRMALYKELIHNYLLLSYFENVTKEDDLTDAFIATEPALRTECFNQTIQNDLTLFYQLPESLEINLCHANLASISRLPKPKGGNSGKISVSSDVPRIFQSLALNFVTRLAGDFYVGYLDKELAKKLMDRSTYRELLAKGKKVSDKSMEGG